MKEGNEIGETIRSVRKQQKMTLAQLASLAGLTQGYLSKIEKSTTAPSVSTLIKIAKALHVRLSYLFGETESEISFSMVKSNERRIMAKQGSEFGYCFEALAPQFLHRRMDPYLMTHRAHSEITPTFQHEGQEMQFVLEGTMGFFHGSKNYIVEEGDCIYYDAGVPHGGSVVGDKDLKCLLIIFSPETQNGE